MSRPAKSAKHREEDEHKAAINPSPQIDLTTESKEPGSRKRIVVPLQGDEEDDYDPIIVSETDSEEEEEEEKESSHAPAAAAAAASAPEEEEEFELLTAEQNTRKDAVYTNGDIVEVEYNAPGEKEERRGYGIIDKMNDELSAAGHRTASIHWIYERQDLTELLDESTLQELNFEDGDYASSDYQQDVNVYNIVGTRNEEMHEVVKFFWDGTTLVPSGANELPEEEELPRRLVILKEWLLSHRIWKDTRFGGDWWFTINSLLSIGHASANLSARIALEGFFMNEDKEPCVSTSVTWEFSHGAQEHCDACGTNRPVSTKWIEKGWVVGKTCRERIDALYQACKYIQEVRATAESNKLHLNAHWLQQVSDNLDALSRTAQLAIAGDHRG